MALDLEKWKSIYYLNNVLKLDEVYDEIQNEVNLVGNQQKFVEITSSQLTNNLSDALSILENNTTDTIYVINDILCSYSIGEDLYTLTGDVYIGGEVINALHDTIVATKGVDWFPLIIGNTDRVVTPGSALGIHADNNAVGGDGSLYLIIMYNNIKFDTNR